MNSRVLELFGHPAVPGRDWLTAVREQQCPLLGRKCLKTRKSEPSIAIGTCTVASGNAWTPIAICPHRFRQGGQVFTDAVHLLTLHEPGNELHVVSEVSIPGGSVDYFLVSARNRKVCDFVGIEFQTLDTTGTVWPERQQFLKSVGVPIDGEIANDNFGMNWKMTAKTILMQLHHKVETFEAINKHFVLVLQDQLFNYMAGAFSFGHLSEPVRLGDIMHFHSYAMASTEGQLSLSLDRRLSTDASGIAKALDLQATARVELEVIVAALEQKMSMATRINLVTVPPLMPSL